jgi:hypothetical protein
MDRTEHQILEDDTLGQLIGLSSAIELLTSHLVKAGVIDPDQLEADARAKFSDENSESHVMASAKKSIQALYRGIQQGRK